MQNTISTITHHLNLIAPMKKTFFIAFICLISSGAFGNSIFFEGFEYANHDNTTPIGWICDDSSWLCGYQVKDHNRVPHAGNWYAYTDSDDSWMFMAQYFDTELRYRPGFWAISDGVYDVEFWAGNEATPSGMTNLLFSATVSSGFYESFTEYIEERRSQRDQRLENFLWDFMDSVPNGNHDLKYDNEKNHEQFGRLSQPCKKHQDGKQGNLWNRIGQIDDRGQISVNLGEIAHEHPKGKADEDGKS